jgi:hypothetical protein
MAILACIGFSFAIFVGIFQPLGVLSYFVVAVLVLSSTVILILTKYLKRILFVDLLRIDPTAPAVERFIPARLLAAWRSAWSTWNL